MSVDVREIQAWRRNRRAAREMDRIRGDEEARHTLECGCECFFAAEEE